MEKIAGNRQFFCALRHIARKFLKCEFAHRRFQIVSSKIRTPTRVTSFFETPCRRLSLRVSCTLPHEAADNSSAHTHSWNIPTISPRDQWPSAALPTPQSSHRRLVQLDQQTLRPSG